MIPPVYLLPVFQQIDPPIRNLHLGVFRKKDEIDVIADLDVSGVFRANVGSRTADILDAATRLCCGGNEGAQNQSEDSGNTAHP